MAIRAPDGANKEKGSFYEVTGVLPLLALNAFFYCIGHLLPPR